MDLRLPIPAVLLFALLGSTAQSVDLTDGLVHLHGETYSVLAGPQTTPTVFRRSGEIDTWVVVVDDAARASVRRTLESSGGRIVGYVPSNAFLVRATSDASSRWEESSDIRRVDRFRSAWKVSPEVALGTRADESRELVLSVYEGESTTAAARAAEGVGARVLDFVDEDSVRRVRVSVDPELVGPLSEVPQVEWIEPAPQLTLRNDVVRWVFQTNLVDDSSISDRGLLGDGHIAGIIDGPIAHLSCYFRDDANLTNFTSAHRKLVGYRSATGLGTDTHGTHVAGTLAGDASPFVTDPVHQGMVPRARLTFTNFRDVNLTSSNLLSFLEAARADGAVIHSNSWGDDNSTTYTLLTRDVDVYTRDHEDALAVWSVSNLATIRTPENAKNTLAVAATLRPPNQHMHSNGGTGPTLSDSRRKPEIMAPGRNTNSARSFDCGTVTQTGTSMAAPVVSGAAIMTREYFLRGFYPTGSEDASDSFNPSGALLKAVLLNATDDVTGEVGYPSNREGWGRLTLEKSLFFAGDERNLWVRDVRHADSRALEDSLVVTYSLEVTSGAVPLALTMAFTDQPGTVSSAIAAVNDLDLEVESPTGQLFRGNVFDTDLGESVVGGSGDPVNNVERVLIPQPALGTWTVRVRGITVPLGPQGFAVVATGRLVVDEQSTGEIDPTGFFLSAPRPSPFRGSTLLRYRMVEAGVAKLTVYNLRGAKVRELVNSSLPPGVFEARWDGTTDEGTQAPAGVYLFRWESGGRTDSQRAVFLN